MFNNRFHQRFQNRFSAAVILAATLVLSWGWTAPAASGTLQFYANGEQLVTEGFLAPKLTKDGWQLTFDHVFVTLTNITAYVTEPPYDAHTAAAITAAARVKLEGIHRVDLAGGAIDDPPVFIGEVGGVPAGHYNAVSWDVVKHPEGSLAGYSMVLIGTAQKGDRKVSFQLRNSEEATYRCGEFVGDERKGFVSPGAVADLELTFHLDHIFGRADKAADDPLNQEAVGFESFAGNIVPQAITLSGMHIGHAGEGHCNVVWRK